MKIRSLFLAAVLTVALGVKAPPVLAGDPPGVEVVDSTLTNESTVESTASQDVDVEVSDQNGSGGEVQDVIVEVNQTIYQEANISQDAAVLKGACCGGGISVENSTISNEASASASASQNVNVVVNAGSILGNVVVTVIQQFAQVFEINQGNSESVQKTESVTQNYAQAASITVPDAFQPNAVGLVTGWSAGPPGTAVHRVWGEGTEETDGTSFFVEQEVQDNGTYYNYAVTHFGPGSDYFLWVEVGGHYFFSLPYTVRDKGDIIWRDVIYTPEDLAVLLKGASPADKERIKNAHTRPEVEWALAMLPNYAEFLRYQAFERDSFTIQDIFTLLSGATAEQLARVGDAKTIGELKQALKALPGYQLLR